MASLPIKQALVAGMFLAALGLMPPTASALSFSMTPTTGLLEGGDFSVLCDGCLLGDPDFGLAGGSSVSIGVAGLLSFDDPDSDGVGTASLTLTLTESFTLVAVGGEVNGVSTLVFSSMTYELEDASATWDGATLAATDFSGSVTGSYTQDGSGGPIGAIAIDGLVVLSQLSCLSNGGVLDCGYSANQLFSSLPISVGGIDGFQLGQAINIAGVIPEPSAGLLALLATVLVAWRPGRAPADLASTL